MGWPRSATPKNLSTAPALVVRRPMGGCGWRHGHATGSSAALWYGFSNPQRPALVAGRERRLSLQHPWPGSDLPRFTVLFEPRLLWDLCSSPSRPSACPPSCKGPHITSVDLCLLLPPLAPCWPSRCLPVLRAPGPARFRPRVLVRAQLLITLLGLGLHPVLRESYERAWGLPQLGLEFIRP